MIKNKNINFKKYIVSSNFNIKKTIIKLNQHGLKLVCVVNKKNYLLGTVSDGDVRRGLLKNFNLKDSIKKIMNKRPKTVKQINEADEINKIFFKYEIQAIPVVDRNGKLIDIITKDKEKYYENFVYIMAGGRGRRMMPLTKSIPKPMLEYSGEPILEKILIKLKSEGFKNVIISINYLGKKIEDYFKDGKDFGLNVSYIREPKEMGTAGSLQKLSNLKNNLPIVISNADLITNLKFKDMLNYHSFNSGDLTVATKKYEYQNPFGVILNKGKKVIKISEKPIYRFNVNAGVYVINHKLLNIVKKNQYLDMPKLIEKLINKKKKINIFPLHETWKDVGNPKDLE